MEKSPSDRDADLTVLVTGATARQGGAVARSLRDAGIGSSRWCVIPRARRQASALIDAARAARVVHLVRSAGFDTYTIFKPAFFMENFLLARRRTPAWAAGRGRRRRHAGAKEAR